MREATLYLFGLLVVSLLSADGILGASLESQPQNVHRIQKRVVGGAEVKVEKWPWIAFINYQVNATLSAICGGSLLTREWVLTAGHCNSNYTGANYAIVLGLFDRSNLTGEEQFFNASRVVVHPHYDVNSFSYDVMLIKLSRPAVLGPTVTTINMVPPGTQTDVLGAPDNFVGSSSTAKECYTAGWGIFSTDFAQRLMQVKLFIHPRVFCLHLTDLYRYGVLRVFQSDPKFCGGLLGTDTCGGDSGGPVVCQHKDSRFYLHGITSYGSTKCATSPPGVYVKIGDVAGWINQQLYCSQQP